MVKINRIYTRTGDDGTTGLVGGARVRKDAARVCAYGTLDETNAALGLARLYCVPGDTLDVVLARLQNELFDLGADLATPESAAKPEHEPLRILPSQVTQLEADIDTFNAQLAPLNSFVLPGGSALAAHLHVARTLTRRAERDMVALHHAESAPHAAAGLPGPPVSAAAMHYINRLSDLLFVLARIANDKGHMDNLWVPGGTR